MPRVFISRMLETYFRRKWLYLLPIVLLVGLGVFSVLQSSSKYKSIGVIEVNRSTVLGTATGNDSGTNFGADEPSTYTARRINTVLDTEVFMDSVIEGAGLTEAVDSGALDPLKLRASIAAGAQGDELVTIAAVTDNAELSYRLASATIDAYRGYEIGNLEKQAESAVATLEDKVTAQRQEIQKQGSDPQARQSAQAELNTLLVALNQARSVGESAATDVATRLPTVDDPKQPPAPEARRKADVQSVVMFFVLGVMVSAAAVVAGTLMDRTVRYSEEVEAQLSVPVLASVPDSRSALAPTGV